LPLLNGDSVTQGVDPARMDPKRSFEAFTHLLIRLSHRPRDGNVVACFPLHERPPTGGSHGKPHRTTKILSDARRRGGDMAARGARVAVGDGEKRTHLSARGSNRSDKQ
jgi:hypothetical protein